MDRGRKCLEKYLEYKIIEILFENWMTKAEEALITALFGIGFISLPFSFENHPLECKRLCGENQGNCTSHKTLTELAFVGSVCKVKIHSLDLRVLPVLIILVAAVLFMIKKSTKTILKYDANLDSFLKFIMKAVMEKNGGMSNSNFIKAASKQSLQIRQNFCKRSLLSKVNSVMVIDHFARIVIAVISVSFFFTWIFPELTSHKLVHKCNLSKAEYQCTSNTFETGLFKVNGVISALFLMAVFVINFYKVLKIVCSKVSSVDASMNKAIKKLKLLRELDLREKKVSRDTALMGEVLEEIYFTNREMRFLLNSIGDRFGISAVLYLFSLFDEEFREELEPGDIKVLGSDVPYQVEIRVSDDHSLLKSVLNSVDGIECNYMIEIDPPIRKNSVYVIPIKPFDPESLAVSPKEEDTEITGLIAIGAPRTLDSLKNFYLDDLKVTFENLELEVNYSFRVSAIVNGKEVAARDQNGFMLREVDTSRD